jgi:subtilisin family serine protease
MTISLRRTGSRTGHRIGAGLLATTALAGTALAVASGIHPTATYNLTATPARLLPATVSTAWQKSTGAGFIVAVLDTGVDATQPDLAGQVLPGYDAIAQGGTADTDPNGHGTHVAVTTAVAYARSKGAVVVAAAGNDRRAGNPVSFPAAVDGVLAVALAAAVPNLTKAPATGPTTPDPAKKAKARPTIKVASLRRLVPFGNTVTTTFTITAFGKPWVQQPVQVCLAPAGSAFTCTDDTTTDRGTVAVRQTALQTYAVKIATTATDSSDPVVSPAATVVVGSRVTLAATAPDALTVSLAGAVGQTVQVQRMSGTRWILATTYPAEADHAVTGLPAGRYRVVVPSTPAMIGSTSAVVRL